MALHNILGKQGENLAVNFLKGIGYEIVACNWRNGRLEVDIIAKDKDFLVFIEVKTRTNEMWGNPEESVTEAKIKRMVAAADSYISQYETDSDIRFDVISILGKGKDIEIEHFIDAFMSPLQ